MATAVGLNAKSSCAAFRAGIVRPNELVYFGDLEGEDEEPDQVIGHVAASRAMDAEGLGKMVGLGVGALQDLLGPANGIGGSEELSTGLYILLPDYSVRELGESEGSTLEEDGADAEPGYLPRHVEFVGDCNLHLTERLLTMAGVQLNPTITRIEYGDQCSFLRLLGEAALDLQADRVNRCIVGAIDSLVTSESLEWASESGRLKTADTPCGFAPGEAAVFLELRAPGSVPRERALGLLGTPAFAEEPFASLESSGPMGLGLSSAMETALASAGDSPIGLLVGDLNGEVQRARDWGYAINRLIPRFPILGDIPSWNPAESFGETGCACPGLAIGLGIQAFQRNYAPTDSILIWCSSETAQRGAICLMRA